MTTKTTVSTRGHLIDAHCQYNTSSILESDGDIFSCILNQTDIKFNKNKFYIMQIIATNGAYILFIRYGRIGEIGRISHQKHTSTSSAISFFKKQFRSKTGNSWEERDDFVKKDKKYYLAEIECVEMSSDESDASGVGSEDSAIQTKLELDDRIIDFLKLISNTVYMNNTLIQLEIDTEKMPLGKISQTQIDKAYKILNKINNSRNYLNKLTKLSSDFYTLIPYACGRRKPPIISTKKLIAKNINL